MELAGRSGRRPRASRRRPQKRRVERRRAAREAAGAGSDLGAGGRVRAREREACIIEIRDCGNGFGVVIRVLEGREI